MYLTNFIPLFLLLSLDQPTGNYQLICGQQAVFLAILN